MAAEIKHDAREGRSNRQLKTSPIKNRIVEIEGDFIERPPFDIEKSIENRRIFLEPFLHYQAILASSSRPTMFSSEQITQFKKLACPPEEAAKPYQSHNEEFDDIAGKYSRLIADFRKMVFPSNSPEDELVRDIEKAFSNYVRQKQEEEEKFYQAKQKALDEKNQQLKVEADKKRAHEVSILLEEERIKLKDCIEKRIKQLVEASERLVFLPEHYPDFQNISVFIGQLSTKEISIIQKHLPALRLDYSSLSEPILKKIKEMRKEINNEKSELEALLENLHSIDQPLELYHATSKISSRSEINTPDFSHEVRLITENYQNLSVQLNTISDQNKNRLELSAKALKENADSLKQKYEAKKKDQVEMMNKKYQVLTHTYGAKKCQEIRKLLDITPLPSDQTFQKSAHDMTKTIWNRIPLLNLIPAFQFRHRKRKNALLGEMQELKRYQLLYRQNAVIAEGLSIKGDISKANANLTQMITASLDIELSGRLFVFPEDRRELIEFAGRLNDYQENFQDQEDLHQIQIKITRPAFQREHSDRHFGCG